MLLSDFTRHAAITDLTRRAVFADISGRVMLQCIVFIEISRLAALQFSFHRLTRHTAVHRFADRARVMLRLS